MVKHLRDMHTRAATLELVSSLDVCFSGDKSTFSDATAFVLTDGQLAKALDCHNVLKAARLEVRRLQDTLSPSPTLKINTELQNSLLVSRSTIRRCVVACQFAKGCDILRSHRHTTSGELCEHMEQLFKRCVGPGTTGQLAVSFIGRPTAQPPLCFAVIDHRSPID